MDSWEKLKLIEELQETDEAIKERDWDDTKRFKALIKKKERILIQLNS